MNNLGVLKVPALPEYQIIVLIGFFRQSRYCDFVMDLTTGGRIFKILNIIAPDMVFMLRSEPDTRANVKP